MATSSGNPETEEYEPESAALELEDVGREWDKLTRRQRQPIVERANLPSSFAIRTWAELPLSKKDAIRMNFREVPAGGNPQEFITISFKGDTTFKPEEIVLEQTFNAENDRVRKLGLRSAKGWSKSKGVLKSWGDGEKPLEDLEETEGNPQSATNPAFTVGDRVTVTIGGRDRLGWIVNTKTTKEHFRHYIVRLDDGEHYEASLGQLKSKVEETKQPAVIPEPTGACYEDAWRLLLKEEEGELVHGSVQTIGRRINHAWVELPTGFIWEPEWEEFMKKASFYERAQPEVEARYTVEEAAVMAARTKNFGPWTDIERAEFLKEKHPPSNPVLTY